MLDYNPHHIFCTKFKNLKSKLLCHKLQKHALMQYWYRGLPMSTANECFWRVCLRAGLL